MANLEHPWQSGPTEVIEHALDHLNRTSDLDQRIGFLLLDAGVETLLKTFLLLPPEVTGVEMSYGKRKRAAEGSFYDLILGVEEAAGERLEDINLAHVKYYHGIRNKLYHQGDGVTVNAGRAKSYALLAVQLLDRLLGVTMDRPLQRSHRFVLEEVEAGTYECPICHEDVEIPAGPVFAFAETLQPVCYPCGTRHDSSDGYQEILCSWWGPAYPSYTDEEQFYP
ncbi:MAG: hypothetical protein ACOC6F_01895 [bacterium]